tara:strand:+ start:620 stop:898 length:279 start_codon:yes stop_codon:yes gene_type:complete
MSIVTILNIVLIILLLNHLFRPKEGMSEGSCKNLKKKILQQEKKIREQQGNINELTIFSNNLEKEIKNQKSSINKNNNQIKSFMNKKKDTKR